MDVMTLGIRYKVPDIPRLSPSPSDGAVATAWGQSSRRAHLESATLDFLSELAWQGWKVNPDPAVADAVPADFPAIARLVVCGGPADGFHELDVVRTDGTPLHHSEVPPEEADRGNALYGQALDRLWRAAAMLGIIHHAGLAGCTDAVRQSTVVRFGDGQRRLSAQRHGHPHHPAMQARRHFQESLAAVGSYALTLFEQPGLAVTPAWFAAMARGCDELNRFLRAYRTDGRRRP